MIRILKLLATGLAALLSLTSCSGRQVVEGGLYSTPAEGGGYSVLKVLKTDKGGVHLRLYSNHYVQPPVKIDESTLYMAGINRKPGENLGMGHAPISWKSFATWGAKFVQQSTVTEDELAGYRMWLEAKGGYF
jgi:hypothetical protein